MGVQEALHLLRDQSRSPHLAPILGGHPGVLVRGVAAAGDQHVRQRHALSVVDEIRGIKVVRMTGVHVAKELVESLAVRIILRQRLAQAKLAKAGRAVAGLFQQFRQCRV